MDTQSTTTDEYAAGIKEAQDLVLHAYGLYLKGEYVPKDQEKLDLLNLEVNFRISENSLDFRKHDKLNEFRVDCLRALGL